jgi:ribose-phosphate pyrophosphokinase
MHTLTLNLVDSSKSDIKYKISKFPDGQQTVDIISTVVNIWGFRNIQIISRLNSFTDLELIICANQALKNIDEQLKIELFVPYFLGARSDRKFVEGGVNYLKQVICPIINSQNFSNVVVMDPHSDVLEACLNNYSKKSNSSLVSYALDDLKRRAFQTALISPDAGALKKIYDIAKQFNITNVTTALKVRDIVSGEILRTELPKMDLNNIENIFIIDDICDGGRTFTELAKVIKNQTDKPIYLVVTHGIFSAGFTELNKYFSGIYSTNSISDIGDYITDSYGNQIKTNLKQLNIF